MRAVGDDWVDDLHVDCDDNAAFWTSLKSFVLISLRAFPSDTFDGIDPVSLRDQPKLATREGDHDVFESMGNTRNKFPETFRSCLSPVMLQH